MVAHLLGGQAHARTPGQQQIARVFFQQRLRRDRIGGPRRLPVGRRRNQQPQQLFHRPFVIVSKPDRQPVEQLWVSGAKALRTEIFQRFNQSVAKKLFPKPVNHHPAHEWVFGAHQPARHLQAVLRRAAGLAGKNGGQTTLYLGSRREPVAPREYVRTAGGRGPFEQNRRGNGGYGPQLV